ncbi:hypothetical protein [Embleya sp. AB8]|uniref:hypothetical protein n=1 Tax=Embleya sp. AB8 TaxID=3156304 RepID=UPI003C756A42
MEFAVDHSEDGAEYLEEIVRYIAREYEVPETEALVRVDRFFRPYRWNFDGEEAIEGLYHRHVDEWARIIYWGFDEWGDPRSPGEGPPRPLPSPGDPRLGGRALDEGNMQINIVLTWDATLDEVGAAVTGHPVTTNGLGARFEVGAFRVGVVPGPGRLDEGRWLLSCRPRADASWQDVVLTTREITCSAELAGAEGADVEMLDFGGPTRILATSHWALL